MNEPGPLTAANAAAHDAQLEAYDDFLEALIRLDFTGVMRALDRFRSLLREHVALEEEVLMPLSLDLCPAARAELERVDGDHRILTRSLAAVHDVLGDVRAAREPRRALVRVLGVVNRPRDVLEHHTLREGARLYPLLDEHLPRGRRDALAARLRAPAGEPRAS